MHVENVCIGAERGEHGTLDNEKQKKYIKSKIFSSIFSIRDEKHDINHCTLLKNACNIRQLCQVINLSTPGNNCFQNFIF